MSLDEELRSAFQEESKKWIAPPELKESILKQVVSKQGGRRMKKWLVASILAATLLIPTGVYAGYNYLADSIYGSQENVASIGGTQERYDELEAKLQFAKQSFTEDEFTTFMSLIKKFGSFNLKYADADGVIHPEQLNAADQETFQRLTVELEPLFEKLSKLESLGKEIDNDKDKLVDRDIFWNGVIENAEKTFSKDELIDFTKKLNEMRSYDAKVMDPDRSLHMERLTEKDKKDLDQLQEQLRPYFDKVGIMIKPSS
ncbi:DUF3600 domain-containing protein [Paenibacillus sp. IHBB 10380]|uniref:DUF3600 domain-containing protein n=1 Tax=Paenibacillus sp. IHBB 10380 TaxID=1566358 RepID=UPI0005CF9423|nr:DUF3600 domain-containing protein [Paenibacillus sp. IHBB 10380]AJS60103.1 hypothetical protein UB51_18285 [Paenibacillus sp. IHBB 10380]